uniref:Uncharacterized protein n=1 Tax=Parascaris univalens TaxID=6257 RepID=A0A915C1H8_PARUN
MLNFRYYLHYRGRSNIEFSIFNAGNVYFNTPSSGNFSGSSEIFHPHGFFPFFAPVEGKKCIVLNYVLRYYFNLFQIISN